MLTISVKPRKLSEASVMMTAPTVMLKMTMMGASTFGSTWRRTVCQGGLPTACAA